MTLQKARPFILSFLKTFIAFAIIKFLLDQYVFKQTFEPYKLLFMSTWMAVIMTWWNHRRQKKAEAILEESETPAESKIKNNQP